MWLLDIPRKTVVPSASHAAPRRHSRAAYGLSRSDCAAGASVVPCASERCDDDAARHVSAQASEVRWRKITRPIRACASDIRSQIMTLSLDHHGCLTPAFSGAARSIPMLMRDWLRGLRCNALLDRHVGKAHNTSYIPLNPSKRFASACLSIIRSGTPLIISFSLGNKTR